MSTSPSWFDQEKFSRLVKKVGPKTPPPAESAPAPSVPAATSPTPSAPPQPQRPAPVSPPPIPPAPAAVEEEAESENQAPLASTARISLVSRPPSLLSEHRALPALPRRTAPLPELKSLFEASSKTVEPEVRKDLPIRAPAIPIDDPNAPPIRATVPLPQPADIREDIRSEAPPSAEAPTPAPMPEIAEAPAEDEIEGIWQKMALLNEELAQTIHERDAAVNDANILREQLRMADDSLEGDTRTEGAKEEIARLVRERDEALAQVQSLKSQAEGSAKPAVPPTFGKPPEGLTKTKELVALTGERDQARKEYADLRKQYESLKQGAATGPLPGAAPKEDASKVRKELELQLDGFRVKLEERNKELALLKASGTGPGGADKLMEEINSLREQLTKTKEEASIAQRGLALSQKALHETRETLREATEGTSLSRHNFDNLKSECAQLTQHNAVMQAQNDQLTRELAAAKSKLTSRL